MSDSMLRAATRDTLLPGIRSSGIQRQMPAAITLDASYIGSCARRLPVSLGLTFLPAL